MGKIVQRVCQGGELRSRTGAPMKTLLLLVFSLFLAGCSQGGDTVEDVVKNGKLQLSAGGKQVEVSLQGMDIFLMDPDRKSGQSETFLVHGEETELAGALPEGLNVGYEEDFAQLVGKTLEIQAEFNPNGEGPIKARLTVGKDTHQVTGGTITVTRFLGPNPNGAGGALEADVELHRSGEEVLKGRLLILAKTWG